MAKLLEKSIEDVKNGKGAKMKIEDIFIDPKLPNIIKNKR